MRCRVNSRAGTYNVDANPSGQTLLRFLKRNVHNATQSAVKNFCDNKDVVAKYLAYKAKGEHIIDRFGQCVGYLDKQYGERNRWFLTILDGYENHEEVFTGTKKEALERAKYLREVEKVGGWNEINELKNIFYGDIII